MTGSAWTLLWLALALVATLVFAAWRRRATALELGSVSTSWLTERRVHDGDYWPR